MSVCSITTGREAMDHLDFAAHGVSDKTRHKWLQNADQDSTWKSIVRRLQLPLIKGSKGPDRIVAGVKKLYSMPLVRALGGEFAIASLPIQDWKISNDDSGIGTSAHSFFTCYMGMLAARKMVAPVVRGTEYNGQPFIAVHLKRRAYLLPQHGEEAGTVEFISPVGKERRSWSTFGAFRLISLSNQMQFEDYIYLGKLTRHYPCGLRDKETGEEGPSMTGDLATVRIAPKT